MKQSNTIHKLASFLQGKKHYVKQTTHPVRDWFIGLATFCLIAALGGLESTYFFLKYQNVYKSSSSSVEETAAYNRGQAQKALEIYSAKEHFYTQNKGVTFTLPVVPAAEPSTATTTESEDEEISGEESLILFE